MANVAGVYRELVPGGLRWLARAEPKHRLSRGSEVLAAHDAVNSPASHFFDNQMGRMGGGGWLCG